MKLNEDDVRVMKDFVMIPVGSSLFVHGSSGAKVYPQVAKMLGKGLEFSIVRRERLKWKGNKQVMDLSFKPYWSEKGRFELQVMKFAGPTMGKEAAEEWLRVLQKSEYSARQAAELAEKLHGIEWKWEALSEEQIRKIRIERGY